MQVTAKIFEDEVEPLMRAAIIWATAAKAAADLVDKNDPTAKPGLMELHTSAAYVGIAALASIAVSLKKLAAQGEVTLKMDVDGLSDDVVEGLLGDLAAQLGGRPNGADRQPQ